MDSIRICIRASTGRHAGPFDHKLKSCYTETVFDHPANLSK